MWGERDGEVHFDPDEAVKGALRTIFARFAEKGSIRQVWLWLRAEELEIPGYFYGPREISWLTRAISPCARDPHQPRVGWRLRLRKDANRTLHRRQRLCPQTPVEAATFGVGRRDSRSP